MIHDQVGSTLQLTFAGIFIAIVIGVTLGIVAAVRHNTWLDTASMSVALLGVSMPSFWLGLLLILFFAVKLHWVPVVGGSGIQGALILPGASRSASGRPRSSRASCVRVCSKCCARST